MGYFKDGKFVESEFYEEPIYQTIRNDNNEDNETNPRRVLINNDKLNPDIFDADGNNLGKADSNANANAEAWAQHEQRQLATKEREKDAEAKFQATEGQGIKRAGKVSFGNNSQLNRLSDDSRSARSTGRFAENRLIL